MKSKTSGNNHDWARFSVRRWVVLVWSAVGLASIISGESTPGKPVQPLNPSLASPTSSNQVFSRAECEFKNGLCNWQASADLLHQHVEDAWLELEQPEDQLLSLELDLNENVVLESQDFCFRLRFDYNGVSSHDFIQLQLLGKNRDLTPSQLTLATHARSWHWNSRQEYQVTIRPNVQQAWTNRLKLNVQAMQVRLYWLKVEPGSCPVSNACTFEPGVRCLDGLNPDEISASDFMVTSFHTIADHLKHYLKLKDEAKDGQYELLLTLPPQLCTSPPQTAACLHLNVLRRPNSRDVFYVILRRLSHNRIVWSSSQTESVGVWNRHLIELPAPIDDHRLVLRISRQSGPFESRDLEIGDFELQPGPCPSPGSCDFARNDWCDYRPASLQDLLGSVGQPTVRNEAQVDGFSLPSFLSSRAYYDLTGLKEETYEDFSWSRFQIAEMVSPELTPTKQSSLTFQYSILGSFKAPQVGPGVELSWFLIGQTQKHVLFHTQDNTEEHRVVCLDLHSTQKFRLHFKLEFRPAKTDTMYKVPIVTLASVQYAQGQECGNAAGPSKLETNDEMAEMLDVSCTFTDNFCGWTTEEHWQIVHNPDDHPLLPRNRAFGGEKHFF